MTTGAGDQRRALEFSSGKTEGPKAVRGGGVLEEGQQLFPTSYTGGLGQRSELLQRGSGRSPDRPKVFHYFQHSGRPLLTL